MLERIGPKIWDRIGPGIAAKFWDDPTKKEDGHLCYSAIDRTASSNAWVCLTQAGLMTPLGCIAAIAAATDPVVWQHGGSTITVILVLASTGASYLSLVGGIRWTQLAPTMAVDGLCDDLFVEGEEEVGVDDEEIEEDLEPEPEDDNVIQVDDDDWGTAS